MGLDSVRRQGHSAGVNRAGHDRKGWALAVVALGTLMTSLDASIVNISLPSIAFTFHTPMGGAIEWVVIAYLVVIAASLLTFGRLSDVVGRKPVWMTGLAVFTLGSAWCGAAGSLEQLILARAFQGIGGALIFAPSFAIITDAFSAGALPVALQPAFLGGFRGTLLVSAALCAVGIFVVLVRGDEYSRRRVTKIANGRTVGRHATPARAVSGRIVRGH